MRWPAPPPLPLDYGAWTLIAIPASLGLATGGTRARAAWLLPLATLLVFLAHHALVPWAQRARERKASPPGYAARRTAWGATYLAAASLIFAGAVFSTTVTARVSVLTVAAVAAVLAATYVLAAVFGRARSMAAEIPGMAGLALLASMMAAAAGRPLNRALFGASVAAFAYSLSSLAFVRSYEGRRRNRRVAIGACVVAHVALAAALAGAAAAGVLPRWWWLPFIPVVLRTAWGLAFPPENLRRLGLREIWVAIAFTAIACVVIR